MKITTVDHLPSLGPIFAKAVLPGGAPAAALPERGLRIESFAVERAKLLAYQRVCGFNVDDRLPHTYPHVLGFPLQATLMSARDFPLPLAGLVHVENAITVHRPLTSADLLDLTVTAENLRAHPKGQVVDLVTHVHADGELVWEGRSTYLARGARAGSAPHSPAATGGVEDAATVRGDGGPAVPNLPIAAIWTLPSGLGRTYAGVSGDVNPIHLSLLTAKAMGFPRAIAHGMWTYARTLGALGSPMAYAGSSHVWFRKPVLLPSRVALVAQVENGRGVAALVAPKDPTRVHLLVEVR